MCDSSSIKSGADYIPNLPNLAKINQMNDEEVLDWLVVLPRSMYRGMSQEAVKNVVTRSDARRYLQELILLNDRSKSELVMIHEQSS